jgi:hypothetical protein
MGCVVQDTTNEECAVIEPEMAMEGIALARRHCAKL